MAKNIHVTTTKAPSQPPGRPKSESPKESVTIRLTPPLIAELDQFAKDNYQNRSTVLEIAAKAMLKRGYVKTLQDAK